eukprot:CAMPEP_0115359544 /NCGR_PEP_ID=MMETSP0270-20121206/101226_1 /TAXON_ID=71861 /ORGANISM="Scrippsiella trochoidea, Strain CCMP3099" /LENGTH=302 /DNA_ID=CAMNT_0002782051 /DNA_START=387 /DNA_END=1293 /DNA_ORIENTATION=+
MRSQKLCQSEGRMEAVASKCRCVRGPTGIPRCRSEFVSTPPTAAAVATCSWLCHHLDDLAKTWSQPVAGCAMAANSLQITGQSKLHIDLGRPPVLCESDEEPLGWLAKYKRAPCDSSTRLPCRAYAAHAALTVSLLSVRLLSTTGRLLTQAQVAVKVLPWCKLSGTTRYDGPGRNQQSTDTELRFRRCAVASSTTAGGACPPHALAVPVRRALRMRVNTNKHETQASKGLEQVREERALALRGSGCTKLKQHSVVSKASNAMAVQAKSMLGICTVSRASSQTPSRILQIVQCAKFCKKSRRP